MQVQSAEQIEKEIINTFGFLPPFFKPALPNSRVLKNLWQQVLSAYVENPMPPLFKEKLAALLSRYCSVSYCLICHSSMLKFLGMSGIDVLKLVQQPTLGYQEFLEKVNSISNLPLRTWPEPDTYLEESVLNCCVSVFLYQDKEKCLSYLRKLFNPEMYNDLIAFLAFIKTSSTWTEAHPEISSTDDPRVQTYLPLLLKEEPGLDEFLKTYQTRVDNQKSFEGEWAAREKLRNEREAERIKLRNLFDHAPIPICLFQGPQHSYVFANPFYMNQLFNGRNLIGKSVREALPPIAGQAIVDRLNEIYRTKKAYHRNSTLVRVIQEDGSLKEFFLNFIFQPLFDSKGNIESILFIGNDVTDQVRSTQILWKSEQEQKRTVERLAEITNRLKTIQTRFDFVAKSIDLGVWFCDLPLGKLDWNTKIKEHFFMAPDSEVSIDQFYEHIHPDDHDYVRTSIDFAMTNHSIYDAEYRSIDPQNPENFKWIRAVGWTSYNDNNRPTRFDGITFDVTRRKRSNDALRESEERYRALTEVSPQIVWMAKPNGELTFYNHAWYEFTGLSVEESLGDGWINIIHPDDKKRIMSQWKHSVCVNTPYEIEVRYRNKTDGKYYWHLSKGKSVVGPDGKVEKWIGVSMNIHTQKMAELGLRAAKELAENANQTKNAFLANMSHEIRTPLGAILGFTDLLKDPTLSDGERTDYMSIVSRNGKALTKVIDDILDISKIEAGRLEIEDVRFNLRDLIKDVVNLFSEKTKIKNVALEVCFKRNLPTSIVSDPARLRQILINMIGNAVKFTGEGKITISAEKEYFKAKSSLISISVKDTGIGMTRKQANRLFKPFTQADNSTTRKYGGSGLGLSLSRKLARALGGDLVIQECTPGAGSTFVLTIEAKQSQSLVEEAREISSDLDFTVDPHFAHQIKVLMVEDSVDLHCLIKAVLSKASMQVEIASNGLEGVQKASTNLYDVILMDMQMPVMDGFNATQRLRERGYRKPIIALTAHAMEEEKRRIYASGCNAHLTKPIDPQLLVKTIQESFEVEK